MASKFEYTTEWNLGRFNKEADILLYYSKKDWELVAVTSWEENGSLRTKYYFKREISASVESVEKVEMTDYKSKPEKWSRPRHVDPDQVRRENIEAGLTTSRDCAIVPPRTERKGKRSE